MGFFGVLQVGPWQEIQLAGNSWGSSPDTRCQDFQSLLCHSSSCPTGFACRGMVCTGDYTTVCLQDADCARNGICRGVCLEQSVDCIKHADCPDDATMCSGVGTCERAVLVVQNRLEAEGENISLGLAVGGSACGTNMREYSLLRASYWGNTGQDVLKAHGMCSFEDWFKYTQVYSKPGCSSDGNGTLLLDPSACVLVDLEQIQSNQTKWWPRGNMRPDLMYVRPTLCDKDYERLEGFTMCAPESGFASIITGGDIRVQTTLGFDRFVRLHASPDSETIVIAKMPEANKSTTGFLGMDAELGSISELSSNPFVTCGMVGQCYPARFTVRGATANRSVHTPQGWVRYDDKDTFTCGGFGIWTEAGCTIDVDRFPLYRALCTEEFKVASCAGIDPATQAKIEQICTDTPAEYQASNQDQTSTLAGLRELFYVISAFTTFDEYLDIVTCAADLFASMEAYATLLGPAHMPTSLYFPFMFSLHEIPFDWFYQCVVMGGARIQPTARGVQNCRAYDRRGEHTPDAYQTLSSAGDSFQTYLRFVRAGYTRANVEAYIETHDTVNLARLDLITERVVQLMYPGGTDASVPRCSKNLLWKVGKHGDAYSASEPYATERRAIIWNWYDGGSCKADWHQLLLTRLEAVGVPRNDWIATLTDQDPDVLLRQDGAGTETIIKEAVRFIKTNLGIDVVQTVFTQTQGVILYNNTPPAAFDHANVPLPASLSPTPSVKQGITAEDDEGVNRTCAFLPLFDPAFSSFDTSSPSCGEPGVVTTGGRTDYIRTCQHTPCSTIPVYYKQDGKFNCRYVAAAVIDDACTEADTSVGCETRVMDQVYARLVLDFTASGWERPEALPPTVMPWFLPSNWTFSGLDLTEALDYERNIQPNPERAVMCEINTDEAGGVRFADCNNPHYLALQRHAELHYKHDGGVIVPAGGQLEWPVQRSILAKGVILSYASTTRPIRRRFMDALFDNMTVCKGESSQHVCRKRKGTSMAFASMNPWTLGSFNPYEVCDVEFTAAGTGSREYVSTYCPEKEGYLCQQYLELSPTGCKAKHRRLVQQLGVPRFKDDVGAYDEYNLCAHVNEEDDDGCMHDQGLLGGYDGLTVGSPPDSSYSMIYGTKYAGENYTVARNLYENSRWSIPADFQKGMFAGTNPLWRGSVAQYGHLQVDPNEIGGHRIGVVVLRVNRSIDNISTMLVERLPLGTQGGGMLLDEPASNGDPVASWVPGLRQAMEAEDLQVRPTYRLTYNATGLGPSCPLQRWAFYSGGYAQFSPRIPAPTRARHLFHRIHGGLLAHPTMRALGRSSASTARPTGSARAPSSLTRPSPSTWSP